MSKHESKRDSKRNELLQQIFAMEKSKPRVAMPADIYLATEKWTRKKVEYFLMLVLNAANEIESIHVVSQGLLNRSMVHPREVFRKAIVKNAAAIVVVHNHPSGGLEPSLEDKEVTKRLHDAGKVIGIPVLDHVIISRKGYYSFLEHGDMP